MRDILTAAGAHKCINFDRSGGSREADDDGGGGEKHERRDATPLRERAARLGEHGEELLRQLAQLKAGEDAESKKEKLA